MTLPVPASPWDKSVDFAVGTSIPPATPHAVSVSLPKWQDNIDYEEGRLTDQMQTGYPRFFIHRTIQQLASVLLAKLAQPGTLDSEPEDCLLVPSKRVADSCREFMQSQYDKQKKGRLAVREVQFCMVLPRSSNDESTTFATDASDDPSSSQLSIHIVLFPKSAFPLAKSFWQHTGDGISSRMAAACLDLLERTGKLNDNRQSQTAARSRENSASSSLQPSEGVAEPSMAMPRSYSRNRHYARAANGLNLSSSSSASSTNSLAPLADANASRQSPTEAEVDKLCSDHLTYVEERYGRNMATIQAPRAKRALRKRIAGMASDEVGEGVDVMQRGEDAVDEKDVYLYPTGMSAIFHAHQVALAVKDAKSVCFGFPYLDTLKILEKWGPGCFFLGQGDGDDLDKLETLLESETITALLCEFPSNPLLRSPDLIRLRGLADRHDFLIVVDETVGNFVNVCVLPFADMVVSSLTKIFSGEANGMGGSLVLNAKGPHYSKLKELQESRYEDNFFNQNAIFLERNSRDFVQRVRRIDENTALLVETLSKAKAGRFAKVIKQIYYPTLISPDNYNRFKRQGAGHGGLLSVTFHSLPASMSFYDALQCAKGPSLGTNFTLASPFVILAHYAELDWAASFGVESNLIRISVGLEDGSRLVDMLTRALEAGLEQV